MYYFIPSFSLMKLFYSKTLAHHILVDCVNIHFNLASSTTADTAHHCVLPFCFKCTCVSQIYFYFGWFFISYLLITIFLIYLTIYIFHFYVHFSFSSDQSLILVEILEFLSPALSHAQTCALYKSLYIYIFLFQLERMVR